ncbi:MAG: CDP-alcohol phosphatidyltransferase family protein [Candidatus Marinimicrobia bacterium]|nr:CDP-alcohol phosphatidyltransferase family protein [Candidatus Neomarinimicrobiota bacterium]
MKLNDIKEKSFKFKKLEDEKSLYARYYVYHVSIRLTRLLLKTNITANQVTIAGILVGILGAVSIMLGTLTSAIVGVILIQIGFIFDGTDGQIARFKNQSSAQGVYLDILNHRILNPLMPLSMGLMVFMNTDNFPLLLLTIVGTIAATNIATTTMQFIIQELLTAGDKKFYNINDLHKGGWYGAKQKSAPMRLIKFFIFHPGNVNFTCVLSIFYYFYPSIATGLIIVFCLSLIGSQLMMIVQWHRKKTIEEIAETTLKKILDTYGNKK